MSSDFIGTFTPRLDEKGRLILPASFRDEVAEGLVLTKGQDRCLSLWTRESFDDSAAELAAAERAAVTGEDRARARMRLRKFTGNGVPQVPDRQGRITIPGELRTYAGLDRDVVVVGAWRRIEVWDRAAWRSYDDDSDDDYSEGGGP